MRKPDWLCFCDTDAMFIPWIVICGVLGYGGAVNLPTLQIISREINVVGNLVGTYNDLVELMTLTTQGRVKLHTTIYPLDSANDAIADLEAGRLIGRGILVP